MDGPTALSLFWYASSMYVAADLWLQTILLAEALAHHLHVTAGRFSRVLSSQDMA